MPGVHDPPHPLSRRSLRDAGVASKTAPPAASPAFSPTAAAAGLCRGGGGPLSPKRGCGGAVRAGGGRLVWGHGRRRCGAWATAQNLVGGHGRRGGGGCNLLAAVKRREVAAAPGGSSDLEAGPDLGRMVLDLGRPGHG